MYDKAKAKKYRQAIATLDKLIVLEAKKLALYHEMRVALVQKAEEYSRR